MQLHQRIVGRHQPRVTSLSWRSRVVHHMRLVWCSAMIKTPFFAILQVLCSRPRSTQPASTSTIWGRLVVSQLRHCFGALCTGLVLAAWVSMAVGQTAAQLATQADAPRLRMIEFFQFPVGPKGLQISPTLREAQGKRVAIQGYVVQQEVAVPGKFLLTPRPVQMSQHADGEADDLPPATLLVSLPADQQDWMVAYTRGLVEVVGVLDVGREEGKDGRVTWVRLQLDSEATKRMNAAQFFSYRHAMQHKH